MAITDLPKEKTDIVTDPRLYTLGIYGQTGLGKTTLAAKMDNPLFLATEAGHKFFEIYKMDINNWGDMVRAQALLLSRKHDYNTIVIDTLDNLVAYAADHVAKSQGVSHLAEIRVKGLGWNMLRLELKRVLLPLENSPKFGVVYISHEKFEKVKTFDGTELDKIMPNTVKTMLDLMNESCDFIGRLYQKYIEVEKKRVLKHVISFDSNPNFISKRRGRYYSEIGEIILDPPEEGWKLVKKGLEKVLGVNKNERSTNESGSVNTGETS